MSEIEPVICELISECEQQINNPPKINGIPDRYVPVIAKSLINVIENNSFVRAELAYSIDLKTNLTPYNSTLAFNALLRLFQMQMMSDNRYPYEDQQICDQELARLLEKREKLKEICYNLIIWNVGSDVETRIAGPKLVAHTIQPDRTQNIDDPYSILSIGSARDHALAMLAENVNLPNVKIDSDWAKDKGFSENAASTLIEWVNHVLSKEIIIGDCYGVDLWPLQDEERGKFLEACRYLPSELLDKEKRNRYGLLENIRKRDKRLHHSSLDFGDDSIFNRRKYQNDECLSKSYDMAVFSTCLYQNHREKRYIMFDNALRLLKHNGLLVVQDFCPEVLGDVVSNHPLDKYDFPGPKQEPYLYKTLVYEKDKPELGFRPFAKWNNGRCEVIRLGELLISKSIYL